MLTLCEFAANNVDGTFTIVRGGIDHWKWDRTLMPVALEIGLMAFLQLPAGTLPAGLHPITASIATPAAIRLAVAFGTVQVNDLLLPSRIVVPIVAGLQLVGMHVIEVTIGGVTYQAALDVREVAA